MVPLPQSLGRGAAPQTYQDEVQRRVRANTPLGFAVLTFCAALATLFEYLRFPERLPAMLVLDAGFVALAAVCLTATRLWPAHAVATVIVAVNVIGVALNAYHAMVGAQIAMCVWTLTALLATTTVTVHWGWRPQLWASIGAFLGFALMLPGQLELELEWGAGVAYLAWVMGLAALGAARIDGALQRDFELARALAHREQQLQSYFDLSPVGIAVLGADLSWIEVNDALCHILGTSRERLLARSWLHILPAAERTDERHQMRRVVSGEIDVRSRECTLTKWDGESLHAIVAVRALPDVGTPAARLMLLIQDITDRWELEESHRRARELAEAAARFTTESLAEASHDFRTPLQSIFGMLDVVLDTDLTPDQHDFLERARRASESLLTLVNDVLDFARIGSGRLPLRPREFTVSSWLDDGLEPLVCLADRKGLRLAWEVAGEVPERVVGDPDRLKQVLVNLVGNAIKFTRHGEVRVRVEPIGLDHDRASGLHLVVADTGPGLTAQECDAVFQPFVRTATADEGPGRGTGLGLAICFRLAELMNGRMWVESRVGAGSRFHFVAPLAAA